MDVKKSYNADKQKVYLSCTVRELVGLIKDRGGLTGSNLPALQPEESVVLLSSQEKTDKSTERTAVKAAVSLSGYTLLLSGVIEKLICREDAYTVFIERQLPRSPSGMKAPAIAHYQAGVLYAFALLTSRAPIEVGLTIRYIHKKSGEEKEFSYSFSPTSLHEAVSPIFALFDPYGKALAADEEKKHEMCRALRFPYPKMREGQKDMIRAVYETIKNRTRLFCDAPTGIGKTVSVLYPALKGLGNQRCDRVFYLTSKGTVQRAVMDSLAALWGEKPFVRTLFLTAKERICQNRLACRDAVCQNQEGYFQRVSAARMELLAMDTVYHRKLISEIAAKHTLCPFALSLELIPYCDLIVCDYNYFFDISPLLLPVARSAEHAVLLIDEAHNLPKRVTDAYSAFLSLDTLLYVKEAVFSLSPDDLSAFDGLVGLYTDLKNRYSKNADIDEDALALFVKEAAFLSENVYPALLYRIRNTENGKEKYAAYRAALSDVLAFLLVAERMDKGGCAYFDDHGKLQLLCIDPAEKIRSVTDVCGSAVFFSATLLPEMYYERLFGMEDDDLFLSIPSPYDGEQLLFMHWPLPQTYRAREENLPSLLQGLATVHQNGGGNVLVFFPSYEYMQLAASRYKETSGGRRMLVQSAEMSHDERNRFLQILKTEERDPYLAFAVMGGFFSESIDLVGDCLRGVVIVGCGMPPPSVAGGKVAEYFAREDENGVGFAYHYPTINRILQAAGRVIRSENDRGFLLLCDERFGDPLYEESYPEHWNEPIRVFSPAEIKANLKEFF